MAQYRVYGRVTSEPTGIEMEGVHVYLAGSTVGVLSDSLGDYTLSGFESRSFELVFSFVGYQPEVINITGLSSDTLINVALKEGVYQLNDVSVRSVRQRKWERYMKKFRVSFLGENFDEDLIEIENEYLLDFKDEGGGGLSVQNNPVLKVRNEYLGYELYFQVETFKQNVEVSSLGYAGFRQLESLTPEDSLQWVKNRIKAYKGSPRHFFKSIIDGNWEEEGFAVTNITERNVIGLDMRSGIEEVRRSVKTGEELGKEANVSIKEREGGIYEIEFKGVLEVYYFDEGNFGSGAQKTEIAISSPLEVFPNGFIRNLKSMTSYGFWSHQGAYEMLPLEYMPEN